LFFFFKEFNGILLKILQNLVMVNQGWVGALSLWPLQLVQIIDQWYVSNVDY